MKKIEEFANKIVEEMCHRFDHDKDVFVKTVDKADGLSKLGIVVHDNNKNMSPCLYIDDIYHGYLSKEISFQDAVKLIYESIVQALEDAPTFNLSDILNWDKVKNSVYIKLINAECNQELLKDIPHKKFLDLAITFSAVVQDTENEYASMDILNNHLEIWDVNIQDLYNVALDNLKRSGDFTFKNIRDMIPDEMLDEEIEVAEPLLYVISNKNTWYGAAVVLHNEFMKMIGEKLQNQIIVLPSSKHELILVTCPEEQNDFSEYSNMVREANRYYVRPDDFLSNSVYRLIRETGEIEKVA